MHSLVGSQNYTPGYWQTLARQFSVTEQLARHLAQKYGTYAPEVLDLAKEAPDLARSLVEGLAPMQAEVVFAARNEMAVTLEDVLARRIGLQLYGWRDAIAAAPAVAELLARELGSSDAAKRAAVTEYQAKVEGFMSEAGITASS